MIEPVVAAYAAGVIDSDGSIWVDQRKRKYGNGYILRVSVRMLTQEVPLWFHRNFDGFYNERVDKKRLHTIYGWTISCRQASAFLQAILPFLVGKSEPAKLAIKLQETYVCGTNRKSPPKEVLETRDSLFNGVRKFNAIGLKRFMNEYYTQGVN